MNYGIRPFRQEDFKNIANWWSSAGECPPLDGMMIEDGTFVLEIEGVAALSLTVFLTQSKEISYLEGFVKNPLFHEFNLNKYGQLLWDHCFKYASDKGYKRIICYCAVEKLIGIYSKFGMTLTCRNLSSLAKEI